MWSRWLPNFAFGYGYPLLNYHPPLAYILAALIHRAGFALLPAMQFTITLFWHTDAPLEARLKVFVQ